MRHPLCLSIIVVILLGLVTIEATTSLILMRDPAAPQVAALATIGGTALGALASLLADLSRVVRVHSTPVIAVTAPVEPLTAQKESSHDPEPEAPSSPPLQIRS